MPLEVLDAEEADWARREMAEHPEVPVAQIVTALTIVHDLHLCGGCS
jgi:hypothetical protein